MLSITDNAAAYLNAALEQANAPEEQCVRLEVQDQSLQATMDNKESNDETYEYKGRTVLVVDKQVAESLDERTLDVEQKEDGYRLFLT